MYTQTHKRMHACIHILPFLSPIPEISLSSSLSKKMFLLKVDTIESTWESLTLRTNKPRLVQHIAQKTGREGGRDEMGRMKRET